MSIFLILALLSSVSGYLDDGVCNRFQATFNIHDVIGSWRVVGFVPVKALPSDLSVSCYTVTFSQADIPGLRWLLDEKLSQPQKSKILTNTTGVAIRQRYQSVDPLDIWSRSVADVNGCFEQVISMKTADNKRTAKQFITHVLSTQMAGKKEPSKVQNSRMQLHSMRTSDGTRLLVQLLWGKVIGAVVYVRHENTRSEEDSLDLEQLKSIEGKLSEIRHQNVTIVECDRQIRKKKIFPKKQQVASK